MAIAPERVKEQYTRDAAHKARGNAAFFKEEHFALLQSIMTPRKAEAGSYLFWEGDEAGYLYYVRKGKVKLRKMTEDGKGLILSIVQEGDLFGEIDGFGGSQHNCSAEVCEDSEIGVIQQKHLEIILFQHGDLAVQFIRWMGIQQRIVQSKLRDLLLFGKAGALASTLIRMANTFGVMKEDGIMLEIKLSNSELADMIGATRESVNRQLSAWKDEGIIDMVKGIIIIRDLAGLRAVFNCPGCPTCPKEQCRL